MGVDKETRMVGWELGTGTGIGTRIGTGAGMMKDWGKDKVEGDGKQRESGIGGKAGVKAGVGGIS